LVFTVLIAIIIVNSGPEK